MFPITGQTAGPNGGTFLGNPGVYISEACLLAVGLYQINDKLPKPSRPTFLVATLI